LIGSTHACPLLVMCSLRRFQIADHRALERLTLAQYSMRLIKAAGVNHLAQSTR